MKPFFCDARPEQVYDVSLNMRERDYAELIATSFANDRKELAEELSGQYGNFPFAFCFGLGGTPIGILTGVNSYPGVWSIGMWATDDLHKVSKFITKICSNEFFGAMRVCGAHRVECHSIVGYDSVHKWLRFLGFRQQAVDGKPVIQEKYGKNGEDFVIFEWVEGMPWPRGYTAEDRVAS